MQADGSSVPSWKVMACLLCRESVAAPLAEPGKASSASPSAAVRRITAFLRVEVPAMSIVREVSIPIKVISTGEWSPLPPGFILHFSQALVFRFYFFLTFSL